MAAFSYFLSYSVFYRAMIVMVFVLLAGCSHLIPPDAGAMKGVMPKIGFKSVAAETRYLLAVGDQLEIKFFYTPELNESVVIRPDGRLSLQLIGEVQAAGSTVDELRSHLQLRYAKTLNDPELAVIVKSFSAPFVYVGGEVRSPGRVVLAGRQMTALEAVLAAGDFNYGAERRNVIVLRNENGQTRVFSLNLRDYISAEVSLPVQAKPRSPRWRCSTGNCVATTRSVPFAANQAADMVLQAQDIVYVPESQISQLARFFKDYLDEILPIYGNMGLVFNYDLKNKISIQTR